MIEVKDLAISFSDKTILSGLDFYLPKGKKATLKGRSGSGKSSVLMSLLGFIEPSSGIIKINGSELDSSTIKQIRSITAWVPQEMEFNLTYTWELLMLPFNFKLNKDCQPSQDEKSRMLLKFDLLPNIIEKPLKNLSGGEKQRISLCSALLQKKPLLLLDEPTSALDSNTKANITKLFTQNNNMTILSASHDDYWAEHNDIVIDITKYQ